MENQKGLDSNGYKNIYEYLENGEKYYADVIKFMTFVLGVSALLTAVSLWGVVAVGTIGMQRLATFFCVISVLSGLGLSKSIYNKKEREKCLQEVMVNFQALYGPERRINPRTFASFKGAKLDKTQPYKGLRIKHMVKEDGKFVRRIAKRENGQRVGTVAYQIVFADKDGVVGALEKVENHVINSYITEKGSQEKVKVIHTYKFVPADQVKSFNDDKLDKITSPKLSKLECLRYLKFMLETSKKSNGKKRTKKPQGR